MECLIKGEFQLKRIYQGKENVFHTLEEFGKEYPLRIQLAGAKPLFKDVLDKDVIRIEANADMREFVKQGSRNTVFYVSDLQYEVFTVNLTSKKGGDK